MRLNLSRIADAGGPAGRSRTAHSWQCIAARETSDNGGAMRRSLGKVWASAAGEQGLVAGLSRSYHRARTVWMHRASHGMN
jgi:hypothetical protein